MASGFQDIAMIENVVLDLGGVLYAIDPPRTGMALRALAGPGAKPMDMHHPLFLDLERGTIEEPEFLDKLRTEIDSKATDGQLIAAWNALLLGPIPGRVDWVRRLADKYRVILLSNTNRIHEKVWGPECKELFEPMEAKFFSFDLGMRKPNRDIHDHVVRTMGLEPATCLFLDDSPDNVTGAIAAGWQSWLVNPADPEHFQQHCLKLLEKV
ncbi:MAG: HAD family phosphatase [Bacteroidia bacterium]